MQKNQEPPVQRSFQLTVTDELYGYCEVTLRRDFTGRSTEMEEVVHIVSNAAGIARMLPPAFTALARAWLVSQGYRVIGPESEPVTYTESLPFEREH